MSAQNDLPQTPAELHKFMDELTYEPAPTAEDAAAMLESLPPAGSDVMIVRSLRLPLEIDQAVAAAAKAEEIPKTVWIRQAIEMALAVQSDDDQPISRAEALRALTLLRPARRVA